MKRVHLTRKQRAALGDDDFGTPVIRKGRPTRRQRERIWAHESYVRRMWLETKGNPVL